MNKYKIVVYAISKNEEKFVKRWVNSMMEADEIYVLDTGSSDNTIELLQKEKVHVKQEIINPFRFDIARNKSLELLPKDTDICVCTDLDEVFEKGWRKQLEKYWQNNTTLASYNYNWSLDNNNKPLVNFNISKIHKYNSYKWINPVHEILKPIIKEENKITIDTITLNHYPDTKKSRKQYLELLELAVKENNKNDRNMHYLGREYMYNKEYDKAIKTLKKHIHLKTATWKDEKAASMRFIARSYKEQKNYKQANYWYNKAIKEAPHLRDAYIEKAILEFEQNNLNKAEKNCLKALNITTKQKTYINEIFSWNETPYDLLSLIYFKQKKYNLSLYFINEALKLNPNDKRLIQNKKIIKKQ